MIEKDSPLYLSFNQHYDGKICIAGLYDGAHYFSELGKPPILGKLIKFELNFVDGFGTIGHHMALSVAHPKLPFLDWTCKSK